MSAVENSPQALHKPTQAKSKYRPEIDGLRAFAVVAVIINHFNKDLLPSGYLGVDIFFVISGYVITSSLAGRESKNFLDFLTGFYERRIKRLVPALVFFVLITSVLISLFNPDPDRALKTGATSLFGLSNLYLLKQSTDYFAQSTELNPFTHTWSLGVEEQFYLLFPFLIWFSGFGQQSSKGARNLFFWVGALTTASLIGFIYLYQVNQPAAYFLMPLRFWEMAAGCLIFLGFQKRVRIERTLEQVPPLLVVAAMVGVMYLPVAAAVPATIGIVVLSAVLIACLKRGTFAYKFFTLEKVVYIGLISYSLYLWHWSVLSISRWTIGIHWWSVPIQTGFMLLLAIGSYKWIEMPLRRKIWFEQKWKTISGGIGLAIIPASFCLALVQTQTNLLFLGTRDKSNGRFENIFASGAITSEDCFVFHELQRAIAVCIEGNERQARPVRTFWLLGDSHAFTLINGMRKLAADKKAILRVITRGGTAFPLPLGYAKLRTTKDWSDRDLASYHFMTKARNVILEKVKSGDVLIVAMRFPYHFGPDTFNSKENEFTYRKNDGTTARGSKRKFFADWLVEVEKLIVSLRSKNAYLIILGPVPEWEDPARCERQWFKISTDECLTQSSYHERIHEKTISSLNNLSQRHSNFRTVDIMKQICPANLCGFYDRKGKHLYTDGDHLNGNAAINYVAPALEKVIDASIIN